MPAEHVVKITFASASFRLFALSYSGLLFRLLGIDLCRIAFAACSTFQTSHALPATARRTESLPYAFTVSSMPFFVFRLPACL